MSEESDTFQHLTNECNWFTYIQQLYETTTRGIKTHPSANRSLVAAISCDDGLDAGAGTLACLDDVGRLQSLPRCSDASLQRLEAGVRDGLDFTLQDAP